MQAKESFKVLDHREESGLDPNDAKALDSYTDRIDLSEKISSIMLGVDKLQATMDKQDGWVYKGHGAT